MTEHNEARRILWLAAVAVALAVLGACSGQRTLTSQRSNSVGLQTPSQTRTGQPSSSSRPSPATQTIIPRPSIIWKPIPFPPLRRRETAAYALRHYGRDTYRLVHPRVIVEHVTVSSTFPPVYSEFSRDVPDYELHELPGLCAHFVIDTDGTIYQLVPLDLMCRHTVGLNYTAIGIEDVGLSDHDVLNNRRQIASSLRLTLWLMARLHIALANVIGHNESLTSPFHRELVARLRCQTHGDWIRADMVRYRTDLAALARRYGVRVGPPPQPHPSGC